MLCASNMICGSTMQCKGQQAFARGARRARPCRSGRALVARAQKQEYNGGGSTPASISSITETVRTEADRFFKRYDFVSTGVGALVVTGYCFYHGQDFGTAISITAFSTIIALVINELTMSDCK